MRNRLLLGWLLLLATAGAAQDRPYTVPAASIDAQFAQYHDELSEKADRLLAATSAVADTLPAASRSETSEQAVRDFAQLYWDGRESSVRSALDRVARMRPVVEPILRAEGIPARVAGLVLIESGGHPEALSPKGARGLWQLMPVTARRYGLVVTAERDERLDVLKSTRAAARYLHDLYLRFGDWELAFAAYNAGEQRVGRAIERSGGARFLALRPQLPTETQNYVPAAMKAAALLGWGSEIATAPSDDRISAVATPARTGSASE